MIIVYKTVKIDVDYYLIYYTWIDRDYVGWVRGIENGCFIYKYL